MLVVQMTNLVSILLGFNILCALKLFDKNNFYIVLKSIAALFGTASDYKYR